MAQDKKSMFVDDEVHWQEIRAELGVNQATLERQSPLKRKIMAFVYNPKTEITLLLFILLSIILLIIEVSMPSKGPPGWMGSMSVKEVTSWFFYTDVAFSVLFALEYLTKLWVAPKRMYFVRHNIVDLLAILPILRVFRIGRAVRLLRLLRLLRLMRIGVIMQQRINGLSEELQRRTAENTIIVVYLLFSLIFGTVGVMVFEKGHNDGFQTLGDGLWWCVVTLTTVGYGDISPKTAGGKVVAVIIMFIGLSFYALLTGLLSTIIIERSKHRESQSMETANMTDHVVVCGWNETGRKLVTDLINSEHDPNIIVLQKDSPLEQLNDPNVHFINGDATTALGLENARVEFATVVVVLPDLSDNRSSQDADARSILTILAVERLNQKIHTVVELLNEENVYHVRNAGCDEVIVSGSYTGTMMSQVVQFPGISDVFNCLFDPGNGTQVTEVSIEKLGQRFSALSQTLYQSTNAIIIGYRRSGELVMSPKDDPILEEGDTIILIRQM